jgi:hypothetical protein
MAKKEAIKLGMLVKDRVTGLRPANIHSLIRR